MIIHKLASKLNSVIKPKCIYNNFFRQVSDSAAYDGDGKTTVRNLNDEHKELNLVNSFSNTGFRLSNNLFIHGSVILFPTHVYSWNVNRGIEITPESLILFDLIVPKVRMIIIGYGQSDEPYDASLPMLLKKKGISCEMLPTPNALTTYNFLVCDSVHVAGAFVPVKTQIVMNKVDNEAWNQNYVNDNYYISNPDVFEDKEAELLEARDKKIAFDEKNTDSSKRTFDNY